MSARGIPIAENVFAALRRMAAGCGVDPPPTVADRIARRQAPAIEEGLDG